MAFLLCSDIEIGNFKSVKPIAVKITKSLFEYVDKATIQLPISARIKNDDQLMSVTEETAKLFSEGDKVTIKLGYNDDLKTEFEGFISRVNFTAPVEIECEGYSYQLRKKTYSKQFRNVELIDVLRFLITPDTGIILDTKNIPSFPISNLLINDNLGTEVLEKIKRKSYNAIFIFFSGNVLYAGLKDFKIKGDVKYRLGYNVIKDNNLKHRVASYAKVQVNVIGENRDGTKVRVVRGNKGPIQDYVIKDKTDFGKSGHVKTIVSHEITDKKSLSIMGDALLKKLTYDGYEGKITAFGAPYCEPGYRCILEDLNFKERAGNYIVQSVETNYGVSGFRRIVEIGDKL